MHPKHERIERDGEDPDNPDPVYPDPPSVLSVTTRGNGVDDARRIRVKVRYTHPEDIDTRTSTVVFKVRGTSASLYDVEDAPTFGDSVLAALTAEAVVADHPLVNGVAGTDEIRSHAQMWIQDCEREADDDD